MLSDHSYKICDDCPTNIKLADMYFILNGNTWYGKYYFVPYDAEKNQVDSKLLKIYNDNKEIIQHLKLRDIPNMSKWIQNAIKIHNIKNINIDNINLCIENLKDRSISKFMKVLLSNKTYKKYCCVFQYILEKVMKKFNIVSFHFKSFCLLL